MTSNPAVAVQTHGQSIWLDYIHRQDFDSGALQHRIDEHGVLGVTSNPSIFQHAIGDSDTYDEAISIMLEDNPDPAIVYEHLAIADIQAASDLFLPIYEQSKRRDGYVSFEVSPLLAHNTETTIAEAKRLHKLVNRPNLMIKIPATEEGIPAIEAVIAEGISVNVTLIFSVSNYEQVARAYLRGLEKRLEAGLPIDHIASVASFFLSRIDSAVDRILENNMRVAQVHADTGRIAANRRLLGQAAIANAKLAYQTFQRIFDESRFQTLREAGAQIQRPLWASTGNKNPAYRDTRYVDMLIGENTVNTVPPKTLEAFLENGTAADTLTKNLDEFLNPHEVMDKLAELGIYIDTITTRLQDDGVDAFIESYEKLLDQVEAKMTVLRSGVMARQKLALGIYAESVSRAIKKLDSEFVNQRIWNKDGSLWTQHGPTIGKISKRMGWLDVLETTDIERLKQFRDTVKGGNYSHVVLMGMGGSTLAPDVLYRTFGRQVGFPEFITLDSTDPERIKQVEQAITLDSTLFIVSSKSGTTLETMIFFDYFYELTGKNGAQFVAITDPETPLAERVITDSLNDVFLNPPDIGGCYNALSYFGMVPAAAMGLEIEKLWDQTRNMIDASHENVPGQYHPGISFGVFMGVLSREGRDKITVYATESMQHFGDWAEQLIAGSLGKNNKGVVPVLEDIGIPSDYVTDRLFVYLRVDDDPDVEEMDTKVRILREAGHPRITMRVPDPYAIAAEFFRWEYATAVAGQLMQVNPFDEPNVAEAKDATQIQLERYASEGHLDLPEPIIGGEHTFLYIDDRTVTPLKEMCRAHGYADDSRTEVLAAQIAGTHAGDYFALLLYFTPDDEIKETLHEIQHRMRSVTKRAVTVGYGPRYLHSTGQLHKGGTNNGVFFQITTNQVIEVPIPGQSYGFETLYEAQALADLETLQKHRRRVIRLHIEGTINNGLQKLLDAVKFVEERRF